MPAVSRDTSSLRFKWDTAYLAGDYQFRAVLVTTTGEEVSRKMSFGQAWNRCGSWGFMARLAISRIDLHP